MAQAPHREFLRGFLHALDGCGLLATDSRVENSLDTPHSKKQKHMSIHAADLTLE